MTSSGFNISISGDSNDSNLVLGSSSGSITETTSANLTSLETKTATLETKTTSLETKTVTLETKTATLETKTTSLETKTATLETKTASLENELNKVTHKVLDDSLLTTNYTNFLNHLLIDASANDPSGNGLELSDASLADRLENLDMKSMFKIPAIYTEFGAFNENTQQWESVKIGQGKQAYSNYEIATGVNLKESVDENSTQRWHSMSKMVVSSTLYKMMDINKVQYDDELRKYLPTFNKNNNLMDASGAKDVYIYRLISDVSSTLGDYRTPVTPFTNWDEISGNAEVQIPQWLLDLSGTGADVSANLDIQAFLTDYGVTYFVEKIENYVPKVRECVHNQLQIPPDWGYIVGQKPNGPFIEIRNALFANNSVYDASGIKTIKDYMTYLCNMTDESMLFFGDTNNTVDYDGPHDLQGYLITEAYNRNVSKTTEISNNWVTSEYKNLQFIVNRYITGPLKIADELFWYIDSSNGPQSSASQNNYLERWFLAGLTNDAYKNSWTKGSINGFPSLTSALPTNPSNLYSRISTNPNCIDVRGASGMQGSAKAFIKFTKALANMGYCVEENIRLLRSTSVARMHSYQDAQFSLLSNDSVNYNKIVKFSGVAPMSNLIYSGQYLNPSRHHTDDLYATDDTGIYQREDATNPYGDIYWMGARGNHIHYNINNKYYIFTASMNPGGAFAFGEMLMKPTGFLLDSLKTTPGWSNV